MDWCNTPDLPGYEPDAFVRHCLIWLVKVAYEMWDTGADGC